MFELTSEEVRTFWIIEGERIQRIDDAIISRYSPVKSFDTDNGDDDLGRDTKLLLGCL